MAWIASLPCAVCGRQPVEVAHVGTRGFGQKCSDLETAPLCIAHHREGRESHHRLGKCFWDFHRIDRAELSARLQRAYARMTKPAQATEHEGEPCHAPVLDSGELALDHLFGLHEPEGLPEQPMPSLWALIEKHDAD